MDYRDQIYLADYHCRGRDELFATPHRDESVEMVQFWSDGGYFIVGNHIFQIRARSILIADAMETHYSNPSDPETYERSKLIISKELFRQVCDLCGLEADTPNGILKDGAVFYNCDQVTGGIPSVDQHFKNATKDFQSLDNPFSQLGILSSLTAILNLILPHLDEAVPQESSSTIDQLAAYIRRQGNHWQNLSREMICQSLCISPSYASHLFKELSGRSLGSYISMLRMAEAKRLLVSSNAKIKDIASALNFEDTTMFCRYFKKYVGCTPRQYRESGGISISSEDL